MNDENFANRRRALLALIAGASVSTSAAPPTTAGTTALPPNSWWAKNRNALRRRTATEGDLCYLAEQGREGLFSLHRGRPPEEDPLEGLYVIAGVAGFWSRIWDGTHGHPEWFGAVTGAGHVDCRAAINACEALCPVIIYRNADYFCQGTLNLSASNRMHRGVRGDGNATLHGTRLILTGPASRTDPVVWIGPRRDPGSIAGYANCIDGDGLSFVRDLSVSGEVAVAPSGLSQDSVIGVSWRWIRDCKWAYVNSIESPVGHSARGVINSKFDYWQAYRSRRGAGPVTSGVVRNDLFVGFDAGGDAPSPGVIGANASIYIGQGVASVNPAIAFPYSAAVKLWGFCGDSFVRAVESVYVAFAVVVDGRIRNGTVAPGTFAHQDISIRNVVADGVGSAGVYIAYTNPAGLITINGLYSAPQGEGAAITLDHSRAQLSIIDVMAPCGGSAVGLRAVNSGAFSIDKFIIRDAGQPAILVGCDGFDVSISTYRSSRLPGPAVNVAKSYRGRIRAIINGVPDAFSAGISLARDSRSLEINGSNIDPTCLTASAACKVLYGGMDASSGPGAEAFQAAGNMLTGARS